MLCGNTAVTVITGVAFVAEFLHCCPKRCMVTTPSANKQRNAVMLNEPNMVYQTVHTQAITPFLPGMANKVITNDVDCHTRRPNVLLSTSIDEAVSGHIYWLGAEV